MNIYFKFPSRSRPNQCLQGYNSIMDNCANPNGLEVKFTIDSDDPKRKEYENLFGKDNLGTGNSLSKIHAVNRDIAVTKKDWQIIACMSDDMRFVMPHFDDIIREDMAKYFPDLDGVLHYNDGHQKGNCMTMSIMGRKYFDRFGFIYHPSYTSLWCDAEATEVAYILGKHKYMGDHTILFNHNHGSVTGEKDLLYLKNENPEMWNKDKANFLNRRANWYGIPEEERVNGMKYPNTI